jgi:hypothetical protein
MKTSRTKLTYIKKEIIPANNDDKALSNADFNRISTTMDAKLKVDYPPSGLVTFIEVDIE